MRRVVQLAGHAPFEVRGHSRAKPGLRRRFGRVCVCSVGVAVAADAALVGVGGPGLALE